MFARASKPTIYRDAYNNQSSSSLDLLKLPFLCPALFGHANRPPKNPATIRATSSKSHLRPSYTASRKIPASRTPSNRRRLASAAAAAIEYEPEPDIYVPWARPPAFTSVNHQPSSDTARISRISTCPPSDHHIITPLILPSTLAISNKRFRLKDSAIGDLHELHQNFQACLRIGRFERAAALLRRLTQIYAPHAAGLLAAHSDYAREVTNEAINTENQRLLKDLHEWFEGYLKGSGIILNAEIYAQMIRASSHLWDVTKARLMRKYQKMADDAGLGTATRALWEMCVDDSNLVCRSANPRLAC